MEIADGYGGGIAQDVLAGLLRRAVARDDLVLAGRSLLADGPHGGGAGRAALLGGLDRRAAPPGCRAPRPVAAARLGRRRPVGRDPRPSPMRRWRRAGCATSGCVGPAGWQLATTAERARARWPRRAADLSPGRVLAARPRRGGRAAPGRSAPRRRTAGLGAARPRRAHRDVRRGHPAGLAAPRRRWGPTSRNGAPSGRRESSKPSLTAAEGLGTSPLSVALAWVRDQPGVAAAVVGARDAAQLGASTAAEAVELPDAIRAALDDVSRRS